MVVNLTETLRNDVDDCDELLLERNLCCLKPIFLAAFIKEKEDYITVSTEIFESVRNELLNLVNMACVDDGNESLFSEDCREHLDKFVFPVRKHFD